MNKNQILFAVVGLLMFFALGYMHELVHVEIYRSYGIDSRIEIFSNFPYMVTIPEYDCQSDICELAHNNNEVFGFQILPFYILFYFFGLLILGKREQE